MARVVRLVIDHAVRYSGESLGVVCVQPAQAERITAALRLALAVHPDPSVLAFFQQGRREPFFVKEVDQVQGEQRDAIVVSVGGVETAGGPSPWWPALEVDDIDRRVNVAVTRARRRMTVVSPIAADGIDPDRCGRGHLLVRDFLRCAAAGGACPVEGRVDEGERALLSDPLLRELAARLRREGLVVREQYGLSARRVDLAVEDPQTPGRLVVAVESDGPDYAVSPTARERERLRPEQLQRRGWRYVRVWSTDIFRDPSREVARVMQAVRTADLPTMAWPRSPEPGGS